MVNPILSSNVKAIKTPNISDNSNISSVSPVKESKKNTEDIFTKRNISIASGVILLAGILAFNRKITTVAKSIFQTLSSKPTRPKYLYHMTSKDAYESILRDGKIKVSDIEKGVFMTSYTNLKDKTPRTALLRMINYYDGGSYLNPSPHRRSGSVVILKIPVEGLNTEKLGFRRIRLGDEDNSTISDELIKFSDYTQRTYKDIIDKPLEFIYKNEISTNKIEKVIEIKTDNWRSRNFVEDFFERIK